MERITSKSIVAFVVLLVLAVVMTIANSQEQRRVRRGPPPGAVTPTDKAPFIGNVQVTPGWNLIISFTSTQTTRPLVEIGPVAPVRNRDGLLTFPVNSFAFSLPVSSDNGRYYSDFDVLLAGLEANRIYYYIINVFNDNPNDATRKRDQETGRFTMASAGNPSYVCQGHVVRGVDGSVSECSPYLCQAGQCTKSCNSVSDCNAPFLCDLNERCILPPGGENIGQVQQALGTVAAQFIGTFGKTPPNYQPMWVYAIKNDGELLWYRKDTGASAWQGAKRVGGGWNFKDVIPAGGNSIYALTEEGNLLWYRHDGFNDGSVNWKGPADVGHGWTFTKIFSGGEGIVYAIKEDGTMLWYRHGGYADGGGPGTWVGPKAVGSGWQDFKDIFSSGEGKVYAVKPDGTLLFYQQIGWETGERSWQEPRQVGTGWANFRQIIPASGGVILAITNDGKLLWYKHLGLTRSVAFARLKETWEGPVEIGLPV